jgi:ribosomal protein S18 acetylase RimI-like enzyme
MPERGRPVSTRLEALHEVRPEDIRRAAAVLARAFEHDPVWAKLFEGVPGDQMAVWYEGPVRYGLKYGRVLATSEQFEGVVAVVPDRYANMTMGRMMRAGTLKMGPRMGLSMSMRAPRLMRAFAPLEPDRNEHMDGRAYRYVMIVGVAPEHQGQGFGGKLLRALLEESDRTGVPIYLETETEDNVRMYEHLGFEVLREITLPVVELPLWEMLREPALRTEHQAR